MSLPNFMTPYLDHPLIKNRSERSFEGLDDPHLKTIMRAEDQIIRGVRNYVLSNRNNPNRLHPGSFSSAISVARALAILDIGTYIKEIDSVIDHVYRITPTAKNNTSIKKSLKETVIPHLLFGRFIEFNEDANIKEIMPYPVASKLYVNSYLVKNPILYNQQINHFDIIGGVQDFPIATNELESEISQPLNFNRDLNALQKIDVVRSHVVSGIDYTFSKEYILGDKAIETWETILESTDSFRTGLRELMQLQGNLGGFISTSQIIEATQLNPRLVNNLMRYIDQSGLSQRVFTINKEDALSRPTAGTLINVNYIEFNNAPSLLSSVRSINRGDEILYKIRETQKVNEDELAEEFELIPVQQIKNTLAEIGLVQPDLLSDGIIQLNLNKNTLLFIDDILTILADSRKVIDPDFDITGSLSESFKKLDPNKIEKNTQKLITEFYNQEVEKTT